MKLQRRRIDNIDVPRQPSGIRNHSNPYSEAMGPIVKEGFVANRIQRLQETQSKLGLPQSLAPNVSRPVSRKAQEYEFCSSPEPDPLPTSHVYRTRSFGPITPQKHVKQPTSHSFSEERWIRSSPSTPVIRNPTGAALYWDTKLQSLRHPPTREALEIRRFRRGHRSYDNVKQSMGSVPEAPSKRSNKSSRSKDRDAYSAQAEEQQGRSPSESEPLQENGVSPPQIQMAEPSIAGQMGDMIHYIDQALEGQYDSIEAHAPDSHDPMNDLYGKRNALARRQLFRESQSTQTTSLSNHTRPSHKETLSSNFSTTDNGLISSGDELGSSMRDGGMRITAQGRQRAATETSSLRGSSGTGWYPTDPVSQPDSRPRAWSLHHADPPENVNQPPVKLRSLANYNTLVCAATTETAKLPDELKPLKPDINELHQSILKEPESVQPIIDGRHQSIPEALAPRNRGPSQTDRKASVSSIRSTSSQASMKWRWWKLALVDKQPKGQESRKRQVSPNFSEVKVQASRQREAGDEDKNPHLPIETILETEAEQDPAPTNEMLDGSPGPEAPAPRSTTLAEVQTRRSSQWVADLPNPEPTVSAAQTPSRPDSLRSSVVREVRKRDQRIKKVQVIVSLDGASDLVVEASLESKRRKSFS